MFESLGGFDVDKKTTSVIVLPSKCPFMLVYFRYILVGSNKNVNFLINNFKIILRMVVGYGTNRKDC